MGVNFGCELRRGARLHQSGAHGVADEIVHHAGLPEADFGFRGMDVDIHLAGRQFEKQQHDRIDRGRNDVAIGLGESVLDQAVANQAAVDEDENRIAIQLLDLGLRDEAVEAHLAGIGWS